MSADEARFPVLLSNGNRVASGDGRRRHATGPSGTIPSPSPPTCSRWSPATSRANRDSFTTMSGRKVDLAIWVREADLPKTAPRDGSAEGSDGVGRAGLWPRI